jgi:hypothetical protein
MPPLTSPPDRPGTTDAPVVRVRTMPTLTGTWPGRAVLIGGLVKLTAIALSRVVGDSFLIDVVGTAGTLALLIGLAYFIGQLIGLAKRQLLWRVRRKLILSYVFVGLVPALLIITFCLLCGLLLFGTVSQYVVDTRLRSGVDQAQFLARSTAMEIGRLRSDEEAGAFLASKQALLAERNPEASLAIVPVGRTCDLPGPVVPTGRLQPSRTITAGPWSHLEPPAVIPDWMPCGGFAGLVAYAIDAPAASAAATTGGVRASQPTYLVMRATALAEGTSPHFAIVLDLPVNEYTARRLNEDSGVELRGITIALRGGASPQHARPGARPVQLGGSEEESRFKPPFFVFTEFADWATGRRGRATLSIGMNIGQIYNRLRPTQLGEGSLDRWVLFVLIVFGVLFLIIEFFALVVGLSLGSLLGLQLAHQRQRLRRHRDRVDARRRHAAVAAAAPDGHRERADALVRVEHAPRGGLADPRQRRPRHAAEQRIELRREPLGAEAADLLVRGEQEDDRPAQLRELELHSGLHALREEHLHVRSPAAVDAVAVEREPERIARPARLVGERHHVEVARQHQPVGLGRSGDRDQVRLPGRALPPALKAHGEAGRDEPIAELAHQCRVAAGADGVHRDEAGGEVVEAGHGIHRESPRGIRFFAFRCGFD